MTITDIDKQLEYELRCQFQEEIRQYLFKTGGKVLTWDLANILSLKAVAVIKTETSVSQTNWRKCLLNVREMVSSLVFCLKPIQTDGVEQQVIDKLEKSIQSELSQAKAEQKEEILNIELFNLSKKLEDSWNKLVGFNQVNEKENKKDFALRLKCLLAYINGLRNSLNGEKEHILLGVWLSDCCGAEAKVDCGEEGTNHFRCTCCNKSCNAHRGKMISKINVI